jgi:hypothetical protein
VKVAVTGFGTPDDITVNYSPEGHQPRSVPFANPGERYTAILGAMPICCTNSWAT